MKYHDFSILGIIRRCARRWVRENTYAKKGTFSLALILFAIALIYSLSAPTPTRDGTLSGIWILESDPRCRIIFKENGHFWLKNPEGKLSGTYVMVNNNSKRFFLDIQGKFASEKREILSIEQDKFLFDPEEKGPDAFVPSPS